MMLKTKLAEIHGRLTLEHFPNEAAVSQGIVIPILRELNWDTDNPRVVYPEHTAGRGRRADFALCDGSGNPKIFIEVKKIGGDLEDGLEKLMQYAQSADVHIVVLTDGRTWSFFLPFEAGKDKEKRVFKLDLSEHSAQESSEVLQRYLERDRVVSVSGEVLETARVFFFLEKYPERSDRAAEWAKVNEAIDKFESARNFLVEALKEDIKPKPAQNNIAHGVVDYFHSLLRKKISHHQAVPTAQPTPPEAEGQVSASPEQEARGRPKPKVRIKELVILDQHYPLVRDQKKAMAIVFEKLQEEDPEFLQRFYKDSQNQRRGGGPLYLGRNLRELFGNNVVEIYRYEQIGRDWIISTNYGWKRKEKIIRLAAKVAGLKFGRDIIINFDD